MLLVVRRCSPETDRGVHSVLGTFLNACCLIANGLREGCGGRGKVAGDAGCQRELHQAPSDSFWNHDVVRRRQLSLNHAEGRMLC